MNGVHFFGNAACVNKAVEAHQHRRQAHKAVQQGDELGHFGHFHFFGFIDAQRRANQHGKQRNRHARDA